MHTKNITRAGINPSEAKKALIMIHGRGGTAENIVSLASKFNMEEFAIFAPQAANNTWYPQSFMAKPEENEPWLTSALDQIDDLVNKIIDFGIPAEKLFFLGFSQGACLMLEYVTRNAKKYGGIVAYTGGLIGDSIYNENYDGDFMGTRIFIGTGDPDPHVPVERVNRTAEILDQMNASVRVEVYKNRPHTISDDEIDQAEKLIFS